MHFLYAAEQYSDINFPDISKHELRPFTIASDPQESDPSFYVYAIGERIPNFYNALTEETNPMLHESSLKLI
mgnify:CR=1 FL=1